jgi:hypothetical protein
VSHRGQSTSSMGWNLPVEAAGTTIEVRSMGASCDPPVTPLVSQPGRESRPHPTIGT